MVTELDGVARQVLLVEDDTATRHIVGRYLKEQGYEVVGAGTGEAALDLLGVRRFEAMVLDLGLPGMRGAEVVPLALEADPALAIIILSGATEASHAVRCMQLGALDYLTKPVNLAALRQALEGALRARLARLERESVARYLWQEVAQRTAEVRVEHQKLERLALGTVEALVTVQEAGNPYLAGHSVRVGECAASLAAQLGRSDEEVELVRRAGQVHDLGMIAVPARILNKRGPLLPPEYAEVKRHVVIGADILSPLPGCRELARLVRHHHEQWSGAGYPDGLAGEAIPWGSRVLAAAEIFDALTTARPYKELMTEELAVAHMQERSGSVLDPEVVDALERVVGRRQTLSFVAPDIIEHEPVELRAPSDAG